MGLLKEAAEEKDSKGAADTKAESDKPEPKKHKKKAKHPASAPAQPEEGNAEQGEEGGAEDQPDAESEGAEQQGGGDGAANVGASQPPQGGEGDQDQGDADAGAAQGDGGQPAQQGQGASPVPSPAAPGAGDTTSGGDDTPDAGGDQDPNAQPPETPGEDTAAGPGSEDSLPQIPMSQGLKDEFNKANDLLMQLLYKAGDDKLATGLLQGLQAQGSGKIKNTAILAVQVVVEIHKRLNLPAQIILPFAKDVTAHVMDLGQQVKGIQYSDQESTAILGTVYEAALRVFGVTNKHVRNLSHAVGHGVLKAHAKKYQDAHAFAKPAMDAAHAAFHNPSLAPQQGAPQPAGPQSGAPAGAQASTQSGAPPTPPPPAQGMLSAASQQPPEQQGEA